MTILEQAVQKIKKQQPDLLDMRLMIAAKYPITLAALPWSYGKRIEGAEHNILQRTSFLQNNDERRGTWRRYRGSVYGA